MAAVNWDGTEIVMDTGDVALSLTLMISCKVLCRSRTTMNTVKKTSMLVFSKV